MTVAVYISNDRWLTNAVLCISVDDNKKYITGKSIALESSKHLYLSHFLAMRTFKWTTWQESYKKIIDFINKLKPYITTNFESTINQHRIKQAIIEMYDNMSMIRRYMTIGKKIA